MNRGSKTGHGNMRGNMTKAAPTSTTGAIRRIGATDAGLTADGPQTRNDSVSQNVFTEGAASFRPLSPRKKTDAAQFLSGPRQRNANGPHPTDHVTCRYNLTISGRPFNG